MSAPVDFSNIERFVNESVDDFRLQFSELPQDMWNMKFDDHDLAQATYCRAANPSLKNLAPVVSRSKILQLQDQIVPRELSQFLVR